MESDNSPRVMLLPDSLPLLHSIQYPTRDEEPSSADVFTTVDIAALSEPLLSGADSGFQMGMGNTWRSTSAAPRRREKPVESKNDKQKPICNGLKTPCHSEESQESEASNSDSDSEDSEGSKSVSSSSSSSCGSSCSASSDSSDSDTDEESSKSSTSQLSKKSIGKSSKGDASPSVPLVNGGDHSKPSAKEMFHHRSKKLKQEYASSSDSRSSSRERKDKGRNNNKRKNIISTTGEPGIKLRLAALKPPTNQHNENYMAVTSATSQSHRASSASSWLSEESSNEAKTPVPAERQKGKQTKSSTSTLHVPEASPQKKSASVSVDKKSAVADLRTSKTSSPSPKNSSNAGSPEKQKTVAPDSPKKKSKLSCLIQSLSSKSRVKANGSALVNGSPSQVKEDLKSRSHPTSPLKQNYATQKNPHSSQDFLNLSQGQNLSPRKFQGANVKHAHSLPSSTGISINQQLNYNNNLNNYGSGQITTPVKTKAAKKYIPDDHLVIPIVVTPATPVSAAPKKGKTDDNKAKKRKRKIKKSSSKDKKKQERKDKKAKKKKSRKKSPNDFDGYNDVCKAIANLSLKGAESEKSCARKSVQPKEPFTFQLRKFTNFDKDLKLPLQIPGPRSNSFPKYPVASSSGRKRKLHIVNDKMMKETSQSSSSNQLQRLPLKKRHHHTSPVDKNYSITLKKEHKFATLPDFKPGEFKTLPSAPICFKWKKDNGRITDFGDLLKPAPTSLTSSTVGKRDETLIETSTKSQKSTAAKKQASPKKKSLISPDITIVTSSNLNNSPESTRRSGRIRNKPKKLNWEKSAEQPNTNQTDYSPQKEISEVAATSKRESRRLKADPCSNQNDDVVIIAESIRTPNLINSSKSKARKRAPPTSPEEEVPAKKIKVEIGTATTADCDTSLNESEISTEVETDLESLQSPPSSATSTPLTSPPQLSMQQILPQAQGKKRRKVNRTGFPSIKKKRKGVSTTSKSTTAAMEADGANRSVPESLQKDFKEEQEVVMKEEASEAETGIPDESEDQIISLDGFSLTLTERVKMRKRISLDGRLSLGESQASDSRPEIPGLIPDLVDLPNPPVVVPLKYNYMPCGLLSNYFKCTDPNSRMRSELEKSNPVLPLPPDAESGEFSTITPKDFRLPFDIWTMGVIRARNIYEAVQQKRREEAEAEKAAAAAARKEEARLARRKSEAAVSSGDPNNAKPKRTKMPEVIPPSWTFKKIKSNSYFVGTKPVTSNEFDQNCICPEGPSKCSTDDCLNRVVYTECPATCGENCKNHRIQKHDWAPGIKRKMTPNKGYGVFTLEKISKGNFILEYVGEVVNEPVFKERMNTIYAGDTHHYCLHLDGGLVIDGHRAGGEGRFVNHSCEPNCEMQKWSVNGLSRMALFALRDIESNEELSYDYNFSLFNPSEGQPCFCGSEKCRGVIGNRPKNGKNGDGNGNGKRGKSLGQVGEKDSNGSQDSASTDKMKHLSKKDKSFIQTHNCFLIRNYEKIRKIKYEVDDKVSIGDKLEKIMTAWLTRYKARSSKNKPPQVPDDDPKLTRLAKISQIFYELYAELTTTKDIESGALLCQPFMTRPSKKKCPQLYATEEEPLDFSQIGKKILRGEYRSIPPFEVDLGHVMTQFEALLDKEKPGLFENIQKIKRKYKEIKLSKIELLEPFIVHKGSKGSSVSNELPLFKEAQVDPRVDDVIRCICDRFSDEGMMIQCDRCCVWQHVECMRVPHTAAQRDPRNGKRNRTSPHRRRKFFSPVQAPAAVAGGVKESLVRYPSVSPSPTYGMSASTSASSSLTCSPTKSVLSRPLNALNDEMVIMADFLLNVKDEIPMEIKEDSNHSNDLPPPGGNAVNQQIDISEAETQRIDVDGDLEMNRPPPELLIREGVGASANSHHHEEQSYYCETCDPRPVDKEVRNTDLDNEQYPDRFHYTTLVREDGFMIRRNDTVYVLRDPPSIPGQTVVIDRPTYRTAGPLVPKDCDIFRIENLWKDPEGKRHAYGHHFVRPSETYHEPNRRFYKNEICRSPASEIISLDLIHGRCWVLDPVTYCKGRPVGSEEEHVYICEFRVDKSNRSFSKVGKNTLAVCMKTFAFNCFETKVHITRNYHPHGPPSPDFKQKPCVSTSGAVPEKGKSKRVDDKTRSTKTQSMLERLKVTKRRTEQRERLKFILDTLQSRLSQFGNQQADLSGLLGRKKQIKKLNMTI